MRRLLLVLMLLMLVAGLPADVFDYPYSGDIGDLPSLSSGESSAVSSYTQTKTVRRLNRSLVSSGTFLLKPGRGMVWVSSKPYASVLFAGRDEVRQRIGQGKTTALDIAENRIYSSIASAIESIVSGDYETALDFFSLYYEEGGDGWTIGFIPEDKALSSYMESVVVKGDGDMLESVLMREASGNTILYEFENLETRGLSDEEEKLFTL